MSRFLCALHLPHVQLQVLGGAGGAGWGGGGGGGGLAGGDGGGGEPGVWFAGAAGAPADIVGKYLIEVHASTVRATQPRRIPLHRRATSLEIRDLVEDICKRSEVFLMILLECATHWL